MRNGGDPSAYYTAYYSQMLRTQSRRQIDPPRGCWKQLSRVNVQRNSIVSFAGINHSLAMAG